KGSEGGSRELTEMSFLLGHLFLDAAVAVCEKAGVSRDDVDLIGSHGHTVFHIPESVDYLGHNVRGTMQIGDVGELCEYFSCPVVSDFRTRDFAAGGMGAPLVPYTEYLLFRSDEYDSAYQNIGGIGNITILRKGCSEDEVRAFDTGPGNVLIDALISHYTGQPYDEGGSFALSGKVSPVLKDFFLSDEYYLKEPPKTTGREYYDSAYVERIIRIADENGISPADTLCTAAWFTAECIRSAVVRSGVCPKRLTVAGGGSHNGAIMSFLREMMPETDVMTGEEAGFSSDSKEAVAFAILANETIFGQVNVLTGASGAGHPSVLGKIQM
ncbi:MAG: anhydro-N-acetylmuramic acid kinase, partial [Bullifex sp.]